MVVSDRGEQWSPKQPPPMTAATVAYTRLVASPPVILKARGITMGIMMAYTPQLVPVKKDMKAQTAKVRASRVTGVIH